MDAVPLPPNKEIVMKQTAKDRVYGPVDFKIIAYSPGEFNRHGRLCFWLGVIVGITLSTVIYFII